MSNDLVVPTDLEDFPGAPFPEAVIDAAVASLRAELGWHIAPERDETLLIDAYGGTVLLLPTAKLIAVRSVRDIADEANPRELDGWRKTSKGWIRRRGGWPCGEETVEVDITHGYDECPAELLPLIAERCQFQSLNATIGQEATGSESVSYRRSAFAAGRMDSRLVPYALQWGA